MTPETLDNLMPIICKWAKEQEKTILKFGDKLNIEQLKDATRIGVKTPEKVRLLKVDVIPFPDNMDIKRAISQTGILTSMTIGLTINYGVFIRSDSWGNNRKLIVHELTHVMQYEKYGGIEKFLKQYIYECHTYGYHVSPLEMEAYKMEKEICSL